MSTTLSKAITSDDGFHHLVYSISGTTHTLFLDNSAIAVNISGGNVFTNYQTISNLFFGIAGDLSYGYTGYLDDIKVFNRALVASDVSAIYNSSIAAGPTIPTGYLYYFKFRGDAVNYGSLSSSVPTASYSGTSPDPNGTIEGKTCLTISTEGDYVYFPAFGSSPTTPPPSNFSFGFWCNMQNIRETHAIADKNFVNGTIWQGDVYDGFLTYVAANTHWTISTGLFYTTLNTWIHIFYTVQNGTTFITYVNGVVVSTQTNGVGSFISLSNYYMILGRAGDAARRYFGGCGMREFVLYNRTLSAAEVNVIYTLTA